MAEPVRGQRIAGAAALIAALTIVARVAGFGRVMVFTWAIGDTDLGDIYLAANLIPNIIFEIVAGGALAGLVVPLLAPAIAAGDRAGVARTTSALLTWAVAILTPMAVAVALLARPIIIALTDDPTGAQVDAGARMLQIFAPQLPLYGVAIILAGVLQAHRRFAWPVLAPLLSSVTVATAYVLFTMVDRRGATVAQVGDAGLLVLAAGTTAGVVVLAGCLVPPVARLGLRMRPVRGFDPQVRRRVGGLAVAGAVTVAAQHLALLVVLWRGLAGPEGTWVLFTLAQAVFLLPWAVLAVPVATAAYPTLAESAATGQHTRYGTTLAATTRAVVLLCLLGAAAMAALATPVATLLVYLMPTGAAEPTGRLAAALVGFAPAVVGYGIFAVLSRALYARGDTRPAAVGAAAGWAAVALAAVALSAAAPADDRAAALTAAHSLGMTVLAAALAYAVVRGAGRRALAGLPRTLGAGVVAAVLATVAGRLVTGLPPGPTPTAGAALWSGMLAGVVVGVVFAAVAWVLARDDVAPLAAAVTRRRRRPRGGEEEPHGRGEEEAHG